MFIYVSLYPGGGWPVSLSSRPGNPHPPILQSYLYSLSTRPLDLCTSWQAPIFLACLSDPSHNTHKLVKLHLGPSRERRNVCLMVFNTPNTHEQFSFLFMYASTQIPSTLSIEKFVCVSAYDNSHDHSHASYFSSVFLGMHGHRHRLSGTGAEFHSPAGLCQGFICRPCGAQGCNHLINWYICVCGNVYMRNSHDYSCA